MSKYFAGIGSRESPMSILSRMKEIAQKLSRDGWILRSGGAKGADTAFFSGTTYGTIPEIFRARDATASAIHCASQFHRAWNKCDNYARMLHGRNAMIILGENLDDPVRFVICWTANGLDSGGTGLGIRIALANDIPVFNLHKDAVRLRLERYSVK